MYIGMGLLLVQSFSVGCHVVPASPDSYNEELQLELYEWTQEAVKTTSK